ncbi:MAG: EAL domain-containing protein, partial [Caldimicrobium sp.]
KTLMDKTFWLNVTDLLKNLKYPLVIEITERDLIVDSEKVAEMLKNLKEEFPFLRIAVDDFGTGYSNLLTLVDLPIDVIKIDLSFVRSLHINARNRVLAKIIIDLAAMLSAKSLAEGVENKEIADILKIMGCNYLQGFYFDKPLPKIEFEKKYLNRHS